ncbi:MAG: histone H3/H4 [Candidatus Nanohaloarchaea archaeon]|jgi:histone H3/H4
MSFSIKSVKRDADNPDDVLITEEALDILSNILEEEGVNILEKATEIAEEKDKSTVKGEEIRKAFFEG